MPSVINMCVMLSVMMLNVIMLSVMAPQTRFVWNKTVYSNLASNQPKQSAHHNPLTQGHRYFRLVLKFIDFIISLNIFILDWMCKVDDHCELEILWLKL
jgi:hypothetical protein